jgi:hypothetical protein
MVEGPAGFQPEERQDALGQAYLLLYQAHTLIADTGGVFKQVNSSSEGACSCQGGGFCMYVTSGSCVIARQTCQPGESHSHVFIEARVKHGRSEKEPRRRLGDAKSKVDKLVQMLQERYTAD